ncbi:hypothetical protein NJR55_12165 [Idiomarina sp. M1R2S28]|uniref:Metallo-beta-lactamase domain-containing protein n=1 Tax=Idiomarina rhizosphaerae TaxID=2961572 RepID=A0A9X2FZF9_9GAMM|nr:hypothetical protein [Idiomarina rhizosphaerae]
MGTEQGIFVTDPINKDAAQYLKKELSERFDQRVRYLAYSHNHVDHTLGGEVMASEGVYKTLNEQSARIKAPRFWPSLYALPTNGKVLKKRAL